MLTLRCVVLCLVVAVAGCSASSSQNVRASAPAASAAAANAQPAAAEAPLDVYPGATKLPTQMNAPMSFCGTKMTTVVYRVKDANAQTVAAWYASHVPGGITITVPAADQSVVEVFQPGGHAAAAISQIHFDPKLANAAKSLGADSTLLGIETFDPPMSPDTIDVVRSAANGDTTAKSKLKAQCASPG